MPHDRKVKLVGDRSIQSKLGRLAYELEHDASRVKDDYPERAELIAGLLDLSARLGNLGRSL